MSALAETQARIDSIRKLRTVVGAMRGIAATHAQQARAALAGFQTYADVVAAGLGRVVPMIASDPPPAPPAPAAATASVVFAAEHGFAGAFSDRALDAVGADPGARLFVVGARGLAMAEQRGWRVTWSAPMASQASGVVATARAVADALYSSFVEGRLWGAEIVHARLSGTTGFEVVRRRLLPLDLAAFAPARPAPSPLVNLAPGELVEQLVGEYVFAELALAALESFASENAARLATMQSARVNIDQKLEQLTGLESLLRQEQITAEVQEITAGALAADDAAARAGA